MTEVYVSRLFHYSTKIITIDVSSFEKRLCLFDEEPDLINLIIQSDKTSFKLNVHINRYNSVYRVTENPSIRWEQTM